MWRALVILFALATSPAAAQDWMAPLKPVDRARIENLGASREKALQLASSGKPEDLRAVQALLAAPAIPLDLTAKLEGRWRCRSFQLGGILALTANPFFECRIVREGDHVFLEKSTGGTRRKATLVFIDPLRMLFYGAYRASGEPQRPYGADDYRDEVGILDQLSPDRLRVELPEPRAYNSARHEVIELVRAR